MKPSAFELFCAYYLGLDKNFCCRFFNLNSLARYYGVSHTKAMEWLREAYIDPETVSHVDFNVAKIHSDIQEACKSNRLEDARSLAKSAFTEYMQKLQKYNEKKFFESVDYDRILGDLTPPADEEKNE